MAKRGSISRTKAFSALNKARANKRREAEARSDSSSKSSFTPEDPALKQQAADYARSYGQKSGSAQTPTAEKPPAAAKKPRVSAKARADFKKQQRQIPAGDYYKASPGPAPSSPQRIGEHPTVKKLASIDRLSKAAEADQRVKKMVELSSSPPTRFKGTVATKPRHEMDINKLRPVGELAGKRKKPKDLSYASPLPEAKMHARKMLHAAQEVRRGAEVRGTEAFGKARQAMHKQMKTAGVSASPATQVGRKAVSAHAAIKAVKVGKKGGRYIQLASGQKRYLK